MTNKIQIKRSSVGGKSPAATDLEIGELAVNFADRDLYTKTAAGAVINLTESLQLGTTATTAAPGDHTHPFAQITATPTTLGGYGIIDALKLGATSTTAAAGDHAHPFADITTTPTTIAGYGITDVAITCFSDKDSYPANGMVKHADGIWRANSILAPAAWDPTKWTRIDTDGVVGTGSGPGGITPVVGSLTDLTAALNQLIASQLYIERDPTASQSIINGGGITDVPLAIQGKLGQTGNLQDWADSTGKMLAAVMPEGSVVIGADPQHLSAGASTAFGATKTTGTRIYPDGSLDMFNATTGGLVEINRHASDVTGGVVAIQTYRSTETNLALDVMAGQTGAAIKVMSATANPVFTVSPLGLTTTVGGLHSPGAGADSFRAGADAGLTNQGDGAVAVGNGAGATSQNQYAVAIGILAGQITQGVSAIAIGNQAGKTSQASSCVSVGARAGETTQELAAVAVGSLAGNKNQGANAVSVGPQAGEDTQGAAAIAIGNFAAQTKQGAQSIAIGERAGQDSQGSFSLALGYAAATQGQGNYSVVMGASTAQYGCGEKVVAIGSSAGGSTGPTVGLGDGCTAIGSGAGYGQTRTLTNTICIGSTSGAVNNNSLGSNSVQIKTPTGSLKMNGTTGDWTHSGTMAPASDKRLKKDIEPITDALSKVQALNGVTFEYLDENLKNRTTGLIAQDVQAVLPEAVIEIDEDGHLGVAYGNMVGLLVEAIKELKAEVELLKQKSN